mmetsp:Transcript_68065/g.219962  ORF Transcript_68065/g.219962 Transcript_68065/m.219962 type:complete len:280 (-) Transcript_68065:1881-2720(-)
MKARSTWGGLPQDGRSSGGAGFRSGWREGAEPPAAPATPRPVRRSGAGGSDPLHEEPLEVRYVRLAACAAREEDARWQQQQRRGHPEERHHHRDCTHSCKKAELAEIQHETAEEQLHRGGHDGIARDVHGALENVRYLLARRPSAACLRDAVGGYGSADGSPIGRSLVFGRRGVHEADDSRRGAFCVVANWQAHRLCVAVRGGHGCHVPAAGWRGRGRRSRACRLQEIPADVQRRLSSVAQEERHDDHLPRAELPLEDAKHDEEGADEDKESQDDEAAD